MPQNTHSDAENNNDNFWAMVVAQLAEQLLPTPEIPSLNPDIGNEIFFERISVNCYPEKTNIVEKKTPGMAH